jgi:hypothetical protein
VNQPADRPEATALHPWKPPADGFERQLRPDRRERRRRPLTRRQVLAIRGSFLLAGAFCAAVFSLDLPAASFWRHEALTLPVGLVVGLVWFTPHQIGQLLGVRPPNDKA